MVMVADVQRVWRFVHERTGVPLSTTTKALGLERNGELVAGVLYEGWNGVNVFMHVAIDAGTYLTREFVRYAFAYPFDELGCARVTGWVEESNAGARRLDAHLGFREETRLRGAATDGGDVIVYAMTRSECRFLRRAPSMARCTKQEIDHHGQQVEQGTAA